MSIFYTKLPDVKDGDIAFAKDVNDINDEADSGFTTVEAALVTLELSVEQWALLAEQWAQEAEDSPVVPGEYSALHWATKGSASAAVALAHAVAAGISETNALSSETSAAADLIATNQDTIDTAADLVATNADVVLTGLDVVSTNADVILTGLDVVSTNADVVSTGLDVVSTHADVVSTNADVVLTGLDVVSTHADVVSTNADVVLTGLDVVSTNADVVLTGLDVVSTNADVVQTGLDLVATNQDTIDTAADLVATNQDTIDTAADLVATNQDTIDTAADRVQTGLDLIATNQDTIDTAADLVATNQDTIDTAADVVTTNADVVLTNTKYDEFDDRYLGDKASDPSLDNDGNALLTGALYWNTTSDEMRVYTGSVWYTAYLPAESVVVGPASAVDERVAVFDGVTGKLIKDSGTTIAEIVPADNSITLAKMAHGTDGNLITYDAAGAPAYVTTGTVGQVLTSGGAGVAPTMADAAGGGLSVDFIASGTLPNGMPVILNADGTVTVVGEVVTPGGDGITAGTPTIFESANSIHISVAMLTSTKAIVTYRDEGNSSYGTSCILDVSGSTITAGTPTIFESASSSDTSVAMLTSTKAIVTYQDGGNSSYGTSCILDVSGSTITAGTPTIFESASSFYTSVAMLTSTKAIVVYRDGGNSYYGTSCILDVSGSTITAGTPTIFESASSFYISVAMLTSTKAIVTYQDGGNSSYGTSCILDVSGSTITAGTPTIFESASSFYTSVAMLTSTKAIVTYQDGGNSDYGTSCILDVSGSTITAGTPTVFESANSSHISVAMLTSTKAIVVYRDGGNSSYGTSCILDVSGSTITAGTPTVFESANSSHTSVAMLTSTKAIVTYQDGGNSDYGTSCILDNESTETNLTTSNFIGITDAAITDTESGSVTVRGGIPTNLTGLTIASDYYVQGDGTLATSADDPSVVAGKAISATSLILKGI